MDGAGGALPSDEVREPVVRRRALQAQDPREEVPPISDHVSAVHRLLDPLRFPFRRTWRDVSVNVQNMRNQYVGVNHKIRTPDGLFGWPDGDNHWENFLKYWEVFGDVELLETKDRDRAAGGKGCGGVTGLDDGDGNGDDYDDGFADRGSEVKAEDGDDVVGAVEVRREEERREREFCRERGSLEQVRKWREAEFQLELESESEIRRRDLEELDEREVAETVRRESEGWAWFTEGFIEEEWLRRMRAEEKREEEEEEMEWRERMVCLQMKREKAMMQMHARLVCQLFGSIEGSVDGFGSVNGGGIGGLHLHPHEVLQNLHHRHHHHHPSGLDGSVNPDGGNSPSEYL